MKQLMLALGCIAMQLTSSAQDSTVTLETLVVTAGRDTSLLSRTNVAVSILTQKESRKLNARSVPEMISELPGVWVQKTSHAGGSPFVRGLTGNQVLELIDGIRLNNATFRYGPNQYLSTIDPFTVTSAEVVRNAYSTLYGSDAIGGVVNILSSEPRFSQYRVVYGSATVKGMTAGMEHTANVKAGFSTKNLGGEFIGTVSDFGDVVGANGFRQTPTSYKQNAAFGKLKWRLSGKHDLTFNYQKLLQRDVDLYDQVTKRGFEFNKILVQERQLGYIRSRITPKSKLIKGIITTLSGQYSNEERSRLKKGSVTVNNEQDKVMTYGLQMDIPMRFSANWEAHTGFDGYLDVVKSQALDSNLSTGLTTQKRGLYADGSRMRSISIFHQQQADIGRFNLNAGLRLNMYKTTIRDPKFGIIDFHPKAIAGNIAVTYRFSGSWKATASVHSAFRAPNISDLSSFGKFDFGTELPSPDLKPERSLNKEVMVQGQLGRFLLSVSAYHNKLSDLIDRVKSTFEGDTIFQGDRVYQKENVGDAMIRGIEAYAQMTASQHWLVSGSFTYTYGQNLTTDQPLRRIPPVFARFNVEYRLKSMYLRLIWNGAGKQDRLAPGDLSDHRIDPNGTPGFGILSLRPGWNYKFFQVEGGLENILDQQHRYHGSGIDGYGRHAWIRLNVAF